MNDNPSAPCKDCGVETWPWEWFLVLDEVWEAADARAGYLCIGCLEDRLDRRLEPDDFPPLPMNDDVEVDSVRLRTRKGSGRNTEQLYELGVTAVVELGHGADVVANALGLEVGLLERFVEDRREERDDGADG